MGTGTGTRTAVLEAPRRFSFVAGAGESVARIAADAN